MLMENSDYEDFFGGIGFGFPENEGQLNTFNRNFEDYSFKGDPTKIDPLKILKKIEKPEKVTKVDYHKRTVLAAEIVYKLQEEGTLGHLKLQKIMYLCQHTMEMSLHTNFLRQAM